MSTYHVFYNPTSGNGRGQRAYDALVNMLKDDDLVAHNVLEICNISGVIDSIPVEYGIILVGGDGTLNHFVNDVDCDSIKHKVYYLAAGSGNDFLNDLNIKKQTKLIEINKYITNLPVVDVNGKTYKFLNGVGYGIDGYCCEEGDRIRGISDKPVNYTAIALKGLLYKYKPTDARITIDGVTTEYKKVWLAPAMNGRFYGGGVMATPDQDRMAEDKKLSVLLYHGKSKMPALCVFPTLYKGTHVKYEKIVSILTGKDIIVEFDRPTAVQIDGETISGVSKYHARVLP